jgi:hypothetical protein
MKSFRRMIIKNKGELSFAIHNRKSTNAAQYNITPKPIMGKGPTGLTIAGGKSIEATQRKH